MKKELKSNYTAPVITNKTAIQAAYKLIKYKIIRNEEISRKREYGRT